MELNNRLAMMSKDRKEEIDLVFMFCTWMILSVMLPWV